MNPAGSRPSHENVSHRRPVIVVLLLAAFLLLPSMAAIGMFMDGAIYAAISRNLAEGVGSIWSPHFSEGLFPIFREHPPLVFWLQSPFFGVLGDSYLTERAYDLVMVVATACLMRAIWRALVELHNANSLAAFWWLPILLWVIVPKWSWTYRNNMLESTLTMFCLLSVFLVLVGLRASGRWKSVAFSSAAAVAALCAFLSKGPVGLFVLVAPMLLMPAFAGLAWRRVLMMQVVLPAVFAALMGALLAWPEAREMLAFYWHKQVVGRSGVSSADIGILLELAKKLAPMLLVLIGIRLWVGRSGRPIAWKATGGPAAAMLGIGFAASLPLMIGDLDSAHYLVPALPFFALGLGLVGAGMLSSAGERVRSALHARPRTRFRIVAAVAAAAILAMTLGRLGEVRKNEEYHAFLARVAEVAGEGGTLGISETLYDDWYLHAIAQRHYRISLVADLAGAEWRLAPVSSAPASGYLESGIRNSRWALRRRDQE